MTKLNAAWHRAHPMPARPSRTERVAWHLEHQRQCGCREVPASLRDEVAKAADEARKKNG